MTLHRLVLCAVFSFLAALDVACAQDSLRFSSFDAPNLTPVAERILTQAYGELGISIEVVRANPRRALLDSTSGKTDGELVRIKSVGAAHASLIRVDVPIVVARTYAYALNPELRGKSFDELKHLRVGHVTGARFAVGMARGFAEVWTADTPEQLFEMLRRNRIDLVIAGEGTGRRLMRELDMPEVFPLLPSLQTLSFYHFLHESRAALVPRIEEVLRRQLKDAAREPDQLPAAPETGARKILHKTGWI